MATYSLWAFFSSSILPEQHSRPQQFVSASPRKAELWGHKKQLPRFGTGSERGRMHRAYVKTPDPEGQARKNRIQDFWDWESGSFLRFLKRA